MSKYHQVGTERSDLTISPKKERKRKTKMLISHSLDQKPTNSSCSFKTLLTESLNIFSRNKHIYFLLFTLITLPLSYLHFHLSLSSDPLKSQIIHLEYLASRAPTRFEARQVWKESRELVVSLLHLKLLYFIPTYILSLLAAVAVIAATESRYNRKTTSFSTLLSAFKANWTRPLVTSICVYVILMLYSTIVYVLKVIIGSSNVKLQFLMWVFVSGLEIYVMAVLGLGLVVSVLEKSFGLDAIGTGFWLMEGRRVTGWVLSGLFAVVTGGIGWRMEGLVDESTAEGWEWAALIALYAVVVVCGFVVSTVFYCECRKRHAVRLENEEEMQAEESQES
ncbi:conserved hypothetical protein [Ricinus communis]|uniref:Transmembrane protein n=1 Tax=Ricinus communis TaxID=3988 RepID=B9T4P5_RICCO|nr:conserved hypothetical protein [Ricinus communis]|eukprot:XP_002533214.1 uncharacterized protein LOC8270699 [Ricinus communis]